MLKNLLAGFKDPVRRPRFVIWSGVAVLGFAVFMIVALGATSTRWFCAQVCHHVQDDAIAAYENSTHSEISCMACHEPVDADPVTFLFAKAKSLLEIPPAVMNTFELPLNPGSALSLKGGHEMGSQQCVQCHSTNREVTPAKGILINHKVHEDKGVWCTVCHNRIAHNELEVKLNNPNGSPSKKHDNFMKMDACFRCHALEGNDKPEGQWQATGKCSACHTASFTLKPANHSEPGFYKLYGDSKGHAELARETRSEVASAAAEAKVLEEEGITPQLTKKASYSSTCHVEKTFCTGCHGVEMPHPAGFAKNHGVVGKKSPKVCANCHAKGAANAAGTAFCNSCHHPQGDPTKPWIPQHFLVVAKDGAVGCFECHKPQFCAECHVGLALGRK